jgi:hypothetical protein
MVLKTPPGSGEEERKLSFDDTELLALYEMGPGITSRNGK